MENNELQREIESYMDGYMPEIAADSEDEDNDKKTEKTDGDDLKDLKNALFPFDNESYSMFVDNLLSGGRLDFAFESPVAIQLADIHSSNHKLPEEKKHKIYSEIIKNAGQRMIHIDENFISNLHHFKYVETQLLNQLYSISLQYGQYNYIMQLLNCHNTVDTHQEYNQEYIQTSNDKIHRALSAFIKITQRYINENDCTTKAMANLSRLAFMTNSLKVYPNSDSFLTHKQDLESEISLVTLVLERLQLISHNKNELRELQGYFYSE